MFIPLPDGESYLDVEKFTYIHACMVNTTHVDFYVTPPKRRKDGKMQRGTPDFIVELPSMKERDIWFQNIFERKL